jgi:hypothetical protein
MYKVGTKVVHKNSPGKGVGTIMKVDKGSHWSYKVAFRNCTAWFSAAELKRDFTGYFVYLWVGLWALIALVVAYAILWGYL